MSDIKLELPDSLPTPGTTFVSTPESAPAKDEAILAEVTATIQQIESLPEEDQRQIEDFAKQIDLHSNDLILRYGVKAQEKLTSFTDSALQGVKSRDLGEVGNLLTEMSVNIKGFNSAADNKFFGTIRSAKKLRAKYTDVCTVLENVKKGLMGQHAMLLVDIKLLDQLFKQNLEYYKELTMYILAGKKRLEEIRNGELAELRKTAETSITASDAFAYQDLENHCNSFEQQLSDLEITRAICLQTAPQIRLVQRTDEQLIRKIQSSINNTIPIWKQKIALALAIQHSEDAAKMQKEITDLTSEMLKETAKKLHVSAVAAAKESERSIVDIDAFKTSNDELLTTIDDVLMIQKEGCEKRIAAEIELRKAEGELRAKLIGVRDQQS